MSVLEVKGPEGLLKKEVIFDTRHENDSSIKPRGTTTTRELACVAWRFLWDAVLGRDALTTKSEACLLGERLTLASRNYAPTKTS